MTPPGRVRVSRVVPVLASSIFVLGTSEFLITGLLPDMAADLGASIPQIGYLISAFAVGMIVWAPAPAVRLRGMGLTAPSLIGVGSVAGAVALGAVSWTVDRRRGAVGQVLAAGVRGRYGER